jgi:hypothetical protein
VSEPEKGAPPTSNATSAHCRGPHGQIEELTAQLRLLAQSHRTQEIEIAAARRDLEVKAAYILMLETTHAERRDQLSALHSHLRHLDDVAYGDLPAAVARAAQAEEQLAPEQARSISLERIAVEATARALIAETENAAFRVRTSTVFADALGRRFRRSGRLHTWARRLLRSAGGH